MIRLRFNSPGLVSCRSQSKLVPLCDGTGRPHHLAGYLEEVEHLEPAVAGRAADQRPPVSAALDAPV